jgi:integrase
MKAEINQIKGKWFVVIRKGDQISKKPVPDKETALKVLSGIEHKLNEKIEVAKDSKQSDKPEKAIKEMTANEKAEKRLIELTSNLEYDTFGSVANRWINESYQYLRKTTQERYLHLLVKWILPKFSSRYIENITRGEIKTLLIKIYESGQSKSTIGLVRDVISNIYLQAIDEEIVNHNPTTKILKRLNLETSKKIKNEPLSIEEMKRFLEICKRDYSEIYEFFMIAFYTGMRMGEIIALEWNDINFDKREISINKHFRRELVHATKTDENRTVRISNDLYVVLRAYRKKHEYYRLFNDNGKYYSQNKIRDYFKRILNSANIRKVRFHDIRHTYASLMLSLGEPVHYVQNQLGHRNASMTMDQYAKFIPTNKMQGRNTLENALHQK